MATKLTQRRQPPRTGIGSGAEPDDKQLRTNERKWGKTVWASGWTGIPTVLLDAQGRLGISPAALTVLLQILKRWWKEDQHPFPSRTDIATASGLGVRTVQRALNELAQAGFLERERRRINGGYTSNVYTFQGLINELRPIAKEKLAARKEQQQRDAEAQKSIARRRARKSKEAAR